MTYATAAASDLVATHCACCARPLVDADSVQTGIGPICRKRHGYDVRALFPKWDEVKKAIPEEYEALEIDKRRPIYNDHEVARLVAGRLVCEIAVEQTGARTTARTIALSALGYEKLAAKIADRLGAVRVKEEGDVLVVEAPKSEAFIAEMRRVPGARWISARRARLVPVASKRSLWGAIRVAFPGALVIGRRIAVA